MPTKPPTFRPDHAARSADEAARAYERRRGSARSRGYGAAWDRASAAHRKRHPLCRGCQALGRYVPAAVTDHVEPHRGDMRKFWCSEWWQSACAWHHSVVKQQLEAMYARGEIGLADLWLDSAVAVALACRLGVGGGGAGQKSTFASPGPVG